MTFERRRDASLLHYVNLSCSELPQGFECSIMGSTRRDDPAQWFSGKSLPATNEEATSHASEEGGSASYSKYQYHTPDANDIERGLDAAQQGGDQFYFISFAWSTGNALADKYDYEQSARCFERMLEAAIGMKEPFLIELSRVARDLCDALLGEEAAEKDLYLALQNLNQSLFQISERDISFAQDVLRANRKALSPARQLTVPSPINSAASSPTILPAAESREAPVDPNAISLRVRFFGRFEVCYRGEGLSLGQNNKALAIFKYLLSRKSRSVSQDYLIEWLWPNSGLRKARWSLNSAIYSLRCTLGQELSSATPSSYVQLKAGYYHLAPELRPSSDVEEFDTRYERGRLLERSQQTLQAIGEYEKALELYRDDYLIEDLYEDWTMIERERLANSYVDMLNRVSRYYAENGRLQRSIQVCYQLLDKDPLHEESYQLLMRCYTRLGLRTRALHQYQLCEQILKRRYGMEPSPDTQDLYKSLMSGENI